MLKDLSKIIEGWDYDPEEVTVRIVQGDDGRQKVQLRVDLGVLQMEMDGRPDGTRPGDCESWLAYYQQKQRAHDTAQGDSPSFELSSEDCGRLWSEGVQHYHRYLSFWHLKLYDLCARDTERNLRLFAFVREHNADEKQTLQFDQWRPYVILMNARAVATPMLDAKRCPEAIRVIESGIDRIRDFFDDYDQSQRAAECAELGSLEQWRDELVTEQASEEAKQPRTPTDILREKLQTAIAAEQFEEAARLRDEIRQSTSDKNV